MIDDLGIVLSGGGVKGVGHIGFLQALKEYGISPKYIAGTSAGALVGALYSAGYDSKEMVEFFKETPLVSWLYYSTTKPGLLDTNKYRVHFEKYLPNNAFEELERQLFIMTTNIEEGTSIAHSKGPLIKPLMASCSVPLIFSPVRIDGTLHSDGGVMNNFPVEPLKEIGVPKILGSYVCSTLPTEAKNLSTSLKVMLRAFDLSQEALCVHKFKQCNYVIAPKELWKVGFLDSKAVNEAYEIGYQTTLAHIDQIIDSLDLDPSLKDRPVHEPSDHLLANTPEEVAASEKEQKEKSTSSYFDIWPLNWAFGKTEEEKVNP